MTDLVRERCRGVMPLSARLEPWQREACADPDGVAALLDEHGSPVNLIDPGPMARNATELQAEAEARGVALRVYFARKANKALALVDRAAELGLGVDVASERELAQALDSGLDPRDLIVTAAVKPAPLLRLCARTSTPVAIDNADELAAYATIARESGAAAPIAVRLAAAPAPGRPPTRFGLQPALALAALADDAAAALRVEGVHFHLDGYAPADRIAAIAESLPLIDALRDRGHPVGFLDIGGGIPVSYLDSESEWEEFWTEHRRGLLGEREPLTCDGEGLGLGVHDGKLVGAPAVYPYFQRPTRSRWLGWILDAPVGTGAETVGQTLVARGLELRCEPGRSLLDGCGLTVARVEFRKQRGDGTWLIGAAMNRTQCRSTSADFLCDPLLLRPHGAGEPTGPIEGYLVGAYCIERELLTWRRLRLGDGVAVGDLIAFVNTAGYQMHILESASHQIPLARNLIVGDGGPRLDRIDVPVGPNRG